MMILWSCLHQVNHAIKFNKINVIIVKRKKVKAKVLNKVEIDDISVPGKMLTVTHFYTSGFYR